jgi:hypothetical protein
LQIAFFATRIINRFLKTLCFTASSCLAGGGVINVIMVA